VVLTATVQSNNGDANIAVCTDDPSVNAAGLRAGERGREAQGNASEQRAFEKLSAIHFVNGVVSKLPGGWRFGFSELIKLRGDVALFLIALVDDDAVAERDALTSGDLKVTRVTIF
jgi:hypothetical protein